MNISLGIQSRIFLQKDFSNANLECKYSKSHWLFYNWYFLQPELVRYWGYDIEEHFVTTDDGYILGMHRIPYGSNGPTNSSTNRPAIFLAHCLVCNSAEFVFGPPSKSLGYILADSGLYWKYYTVRPHSTLSLCPRKT